MTTNNQHNTIESLQLSQVTNQLNDYDTEAMVNIYNQYADANSYEHIYDNDEITINSMYDSPWTAVSLTNHDGYKDHQDYFTYNGYGHMISFDYLTDDNCPIDIDELAQWIVNNELYSDFDIEVTTLDDMLASIEDNISDDRYILSKLADYLGQSLNPENVKLLKTDDDYHDSLVNDFVFELSDYSFSDLNDLINTVGIDYSVNK